MNLQNCKFFFPKKLYLSKSTVPWSRHFWTTLISVVPVRCTGDRRRGLETIYTRTANASVDFSAVGCDFRVIIFVVVGFWKITHFQWEIQDPIYWRYLPYIRPIFQGYVRGYPPKMWPTIWYTYLHVLDPGIPIDITRCFVFMFYPVVNLRERAS